MINEFNGVGNLGMAPVMESVEVSGEPRKVTNMRVFFDRPILDDADGKYKDKGGFWLPVDIWGYRAEEAMRVLKKGTRIFVNGSLREEVWHDESGEERSRIHLSANYLFIDTVCIDSITYKNNGQNKT
jgi:single-strand DNA-binding protein